MRSATIGQPSRSAENGLHNDLEVVTRSNGETDFTFVLNHGRETITVELPADMHGDLATACRDLLTGEAVGATLTLPRFGAAVIAHPSLDEAPFITLAAPAGATH